VNERTLSCWEEFEDSVARLDEEHAARRGTGTYISNLLFRGQSDSQWPLATTLDRFCAPAEVSLIQYYRIIFQAKPRIEAFTGRQWPVLDVANYAEWLKTFTPGSEDEVKSTEYLAYLRHHGFPSPLLDWTQSPYIAAFFALRHPVKCATYFSIFTYLEWATGHKSGAAGQPEIRGLGPRARVHSRHFFQQSEYTVCMVERQDGIFYARHQDVFSRNTDDQDLLWKFNVPTSERHKILRKLIRMNVNAFSLFGSEESLLEDIATADILLA
jgi:hypothetical protein